jgi:hypothetical protein
VKNIKTFWQIWMISLTKPWDPSRVLILLKLIYHIRRKWWKYFSLKYLIAKVNLCRIHDFVCIWNIFNFVRASPRNTLWLHHHHHHHLQHNHNHCKIFSFIFKIYFEKYVIVCNKKAIYSINRLYKIRKIQIHEKKK